MSTAKEKARFLEFKTHPYGTKNPDGSLMLNRYSSILTGGYNFPGAQAMLYAAGVKNQDDMRTKPHVGMCISSPNIFLLPAFLIHSFRSCIGLVGGKSLQVTLTPRQFNQPLLLRIFSPLPNSMHCMSALKPSPLVFDSLTNPKYLTSAKP